MGTRGLTTLPQGYQEHLLSKTRSEDRQVSMDLTSPWNEILFLSSVLALLVGRQVGHPTFKQAACWFVDGVNLTGALHVL